MYFVDIIINTVTVIFGNLFLIVLALAAIFSSLSAILSFSEENRIFFAKTKTVVSVIISIFGILLFFREDAKIGAVLTCLWPLLLYKPLPFQIFAQIIILSVSSLIYWITYICRHDVFLVQSIGDILLFVIFPTMFTLVNFSRGAENLTGKENGNANKIHLRSLLSKGYSLLNQVIPPN